MTAPDWRAVESIVNNASIPAAPSFDLFISRRNEQEFFIQLDIPLEKDHEKAEKSDRIPINIPEGLHDLYW